MAFARAAIQGLGTGFSAAGGDPGSSTEAPSFDRGAPCEPLRGSAFGLGIEGFARRMRSGVHAGLVKHGRHVREHAVHDPHSGIPIDVFWQAGRLPKGVWVPDQRVEPYRGRG